MWSRAIFVFGMLLLVSLGLCGLNVVAVLGVNGAIRGAHNGPIRQAISRALVGFGYVELFGMAVGVVGIAISFVGAAVSALIPRRRT